MFSELSPFFTKWGHMIKCWGMMLRILCMTPFLIVSCEVLIPQWNVTCELTGVPVCDYNKVAVMTTGSLLYLCMLVGMVG